MSRPLRMSPRDIPRIRRTCREKLRIEVIATAGIPIIREDRARAPVEVTRDRTAGQDRVLTVGRDPTHDPIRDPTHDRTHGRTRDPIRDPIRDPARDPARDPDHTRVQDPDLTRVRTIALIQITTLGIEALLITTTM